VVRLLKDPQRLLNMQVSSVAETAASSARAKPIFAAEQISAYWQEWANDNQNNYPALRIDTLKDKDGNPIAPGPIGFTQPASTPPAVADLINLTNGAIEEIGGGRQDVNKMRSNISAEAVELIHTDLDADSYNYIDNGAIGKAWGGTVWLGMAKEIYVEDDRAMKTVDSQGKSGSVVLNRPMSGDNGAYTQNDISSASFDVNVEIGPASKTRKDAVLRMMKDFMQIPTMDPQTAQILQWYAISNLEGDGLTGLQDYAHQKLVAAGAIKPTEEEAKAMSEAAQNQQPDAQTQWALAAADKEKALAGKAQAEMMETLANIDQIRSKTELTRVQALEGLAGIDQAKKAAWLQLLQYLDTQDAAMRNVSGQPS